jgi:hypothetical protein
LGKIKEGEKMRKKTLGILLVSFLILVLSSAGLAQRQTGSLRGTIIDEQGNPLPGVNITVTSPAMQGQQTYISTNDGEFRFPTLPPGEYTIRAELSGFQKIERPGIIVSVGKAVSVIIQMKMAAVEEEVTVTAAAPVVDVQSSGIAVTIDKDIIKTIPVRRSILDLYRMAPATTGQSETYDYQKQSVVHGGAVQESKISLDGVDLLDPMRGYILADVAFDAVDEVEISLGGHKAEVGQVMAGYVNVVSKSGGNKFSGSITGVLNTKNITQNAIPLEQIEAAGLEKPITWNYKRDIGGDFGGPIFKDKLWFYISPRYNDRKKNTAFVPFTDPDGISHGTWDFTHSEIAGLGKLTTTFGKNMKWTGMYEYYKNKDHPDPWDVYEKYMSWEAVSGHVMNDSGHVFSSILTFIHNQNTFSEFRAGYVFKTLELHQENTEGPKSRPYTYDEYTGLQWGSANDGGEWYDKHSLTFNLNTTRFQDDFLGMDHEFKAGVEYGYSDSTSEFPLQEWQSSYRRWWWNGTPWAYQETEPYCGYVEIISGDKKLHEMPRKYGVWRYGGFIQDSLTIGKRFTFNVGVRYDEYHGFKRKEILKGWTDPNNGLANILLPEIFSPVDLECPEIKDIMVFKNFSPRIGGTFDLFGNGKTALKASYARYKEVLMGEQISGLDAFGQPWIGFTWYDDNHDGEFDLPPIDRYEPDSYASYNPDPAKLRQKIDPNITAPYTDEFIVGIQQELARDFSLSLNFVYKDARNFQGQRNLVNPKTSDVWVPYTVTDPGWDQEFGTSDDQQLTVYMKKREAEPDILQKKNIPDAWRKYRGIDFILYKRMSNNWMMSANITYSKAWGNQPHGYHSHLGSLNWDNPNWLVNRVSRLEFDRPLLVKLMGTVILPYDIRASMYYRYTSGSPWGRQMTVYFPTTVNGFYPKSRSVTVQAEPVGKRTGAPEINNFDMRVEKEFKVGPGTLGLWIEVFNLFGYYKYDFSQDRGGYLYPDGTFERFGTYGQVRSAEGYRTANIAFRYTF